MAKRKARQKVSTEEKEIQAKETKNISMGLAIISLILNVIFLPGLGTLIANKIKIGIWQIILWLIGAISVSIAYIYGTAIFFIGLPLVIAAWIWGIFTGVQLIQKAK